MGTGVARSKSRTHDFMLVRSFSCFFSTLIGKAEVLMSGNRAVSRWTLRRLAICASVIATLSIQSTSYAVVMIFDGFGDADRNNDGCITVDTDLNDSGTLNDFTGTPPTATGPDSALANRGITEVTAATDPSDVGIIWSGIRSFDTTATSAKAKLRIINDNVADRLETCVTNSQRWFGTGRGIARRRQLDSWAVSAID